MSQDPQGQPFSESNLDSPEYRERLLRKLNCLIAVLEVATAKVRRTLESPGADIERLQKIRRNLQDTLDVCLRARTALEKHRTLPKGIAGELAHIVDPEALKPAALEREEERRRETSGAHPRRGRDVELSSPAERRKFTKLGPISIRAIQACDLDELARRLQR